MVQKERPRTERVIHASSVLALALVQLETLQFGRATVRKS